MNPTALACTTIATLGLLGAAWLTAGPLTPPPGAPAPTYKTLQEVEPRTPISALPLIINQPGSYYLTAPLVNSNFITDSIRINASNVTLDLNGYSISGGARSIVIEPAASNVTIRDGSISNTFDGILALPGPGGTLASGVSVLNVTMEAIGGQALTLGDSAAVERVNVLGQPATLNRGITVGRASRVVNTSVSTVASLAFALGEGTVASLCVANDVTNGDGFLLDARVRLTDSVATNINGNGINTNPAQFGPNNIMSVVIDRCTVSNISQNGIFLQGNHAQVTNSTISNTGFFSTFSGPQSSGVLVTGSGNRIDSNRFFRAHYPVFLTASTAQNTVVRNVASVAPLGFVDQAPPINANRIATTTGTIPTGPWDNMIQ